jgi:hypothetical protein
MSTTISPEELLDRATELAKCERNMEIMDRATILRGYLEIRTLDPENGIYRKNVEDAVTSLRLVARL